MGFCTTEKCILCDFCKNWFHQRCAKLSNAKFDEFSNNDSTIFKCSICVKPKKCHVCGDNGLNTSNSLYCVTCLQDFCDSCNSLPNSLIHSIRTTETPFYCSSCSLFYPCGICGDHCYNDSIHQPSINCDLCQQWVHHKCSKLTINQFNKYGKTSIPFYCTKCVAENVPFTNLSRPKFNTLNEDNPSLNNTAINKSSNTNACTHCVVCNSECNNCVNCPNMHRVCNSCIECKYLDLTE